MNNLALKMHVASILMAGITAFDYMPPWLSGTPVRYKDQYVRVSHQAKQASIARYRRKRDRQLMTVEETGSGSNPSEWTVNSVEMDYSPLDCPPDWVDLLDQDPNAGACLPYNTFLNPAVDANFTTMMGVGVQPAMVADASGEEFNYAGDNGYAVPDPFGSPPICQDLVVEDCKYSTKATRKLTNGVTDDFGGDYYPNNLGQGGTCTKNDAATQWLDCGIPCPAPFEMSKGELSVTFGTPVIIFCVVCCILGLIAFKYVGGDPTNYFVAGRKLSLPVVAATLSGQGIDGSGTMGNIDLAYNYHFWDGFALPFGIAWSLVLVGIFFARPLNDMKLLTLPDVFGRKFGPAAEASFAFFAIISFVMLFASNLVGFGKVIDYVFQIGDPFAGILISGIFVWVYTVAGGILSVAYTDIFQGLIGYLGLLVGTAYVYANLPRAAGVSPAYPLGDKNAFAEGMTDPDSYDPIPNAIFFNWVTIFVLAFGNIAAIDFQARVLAAKDGGTAQKGCFIAAAMVFLIGGFTSANGGAIRALYGPSSPHAEFVADSCSRYITVVGCFGPDQCNAVPLPGVPTCGEWKPDPFAPLKMMTCYKENCHYFLDFDGSAGFDAGSEHNFPMPAFLGGWMLIAIIAASISTGDGSILAMGTCFSHNILRKFYPFPDEKLLFFTRTSSAFWTALSIAVACAGPTLTGYFLIVAFDIMLAGAVIPLFAAVYWKSCKPIAAIAAIHAGSWTRLILEFALPKDGLLLLFGDYASSFAAGIYDLDKLGIFLDPDGDMDSVCPQYQLEDFSGVDSLLSPVVCLITLLVVQALPIDPKGKWLTPVPAPPEVRAGASKTAESTPDEQKAPGPSQPAEEEVLEMAEVERATA